MTHTAVVTGSNTPTYMGNKRSVCPSSHRIWKHPHKSGERQLYYYTVKYYDRESGVKNVKTY
jgi:hypothetical protein